MRFLPVVGAGAFLSSLDTRDETLNPEPPNPKMSYDFRMRLEGFVLFFFFGGGGWLEFLGL